MSHNPRSAFGPGNLPTRERGALIGITVVGALLRIVFQAGRSFTGDEVGTLLFMQKTPSYILSHFETWLSMNYYILVEKWVATYLCAGDWCLVALTLIASIATIPAVMSLALKLSDRPTAFAAAVLTALNPFLISYSSLIRSYSLLVLFSVLAFDRMLLWIEDRTWRNTLVCSLCVLVGALLHPNMVYTVLLLVVILALGAARRWVRLAEVAKFLLTLVATGLVLVAMYWRIYPEFRNVQKEYSVPGPTFRLYPTAVFMAYVGDPYMSGSRLPALVGILFVAAGIHAAIRRHRRLLLLVPAVVLPFVVASLTGLAHYPWAIARFFIFIVPYLLILMGAGAVWTVSRFPALPHSVNVGAGLLLVGGLWCPPMLGVIRLKESQPFKSAAAEMLRDAGPGTRVVAAGLDRIALIPYFRFQGNAPHYFAPRVLELIDVKQADLTRPDDLFFVSTEKPLRTARPSERIGDISIVRYTSDGSRSAIEQLQSDLGFPAQ